MMGGVVEELTIPSSGGGPSGALLDDTAHPSPWSLPPHSALCLAPGRLCSAHLSPAGGAQLRPVGRQGGPPVGSPV